MNNICPTSVDLIVTSPPYLNNYHYNRNTRPHLYWLGYAEKPKDFNPLEQANFGKYWQTVRELERVELEVTLPGSDLATNIEILRGLKVEKGIYGGMVGQTMQQRTSTIVVSWREALVMC